MKKVSIPLLIICMMLTVLLIGCDPKNELLDGQMRLVVSALNDKDAERLKDCMMPGILDEQSLMQGFDDMERIWVPVKADDVQMVRFDKRTSVAADVKTVTYAGIYRLPRTDAAWYLRLTYQEVGDQKGLVGVFVSQGEENTGTTRNMAQTAMDLFCLAAAIITIVDIVRRKPRKYGWYILLALFIFRLYAFANGAATFYLRLPLGAMVYWCLRKRIMATAPSAKSKAFPTDLESPEAMETSEGPEPAETPKGPEPTETLETGDGAD